MCGIVGVLYRDGTRPEPELLRSMAATIQHRGPDGEGAQSFPGCGLAHRRLAIIDLSDAAAQPMPAADGAVWVSFNGEVYNFLDLRRQLEQLGHPFRTSSDTEVILEAYLEWGEAFISRLEGMFALAIWDGRTERLFLARDRTGKKPLFVYEDQRCIVFASEIKAILAHPGLDVSLNRSAVPLYLSHGYVPSPATFHARIRKLRPATCEVFHLREWRHEATCYWKYPSSDDASIATGDLPQVEARIRELFFAAVERRMVADVPVGAFLSGGIDSTLVVAAMSKVSSSPVRTLSIGFEGFPAWDETRFARTVATHFGTIHSEFKVKPADFATVEKLSWHLDEPFGDSSIVPTYVMSSLARQQVKVALTGDGGDEVFGGYPRFAAAALAELVPAPARALVGCIAAYLPQGRNHHGAWERLRRLAMVASRRLPTRLQGWMTFFTTTELRELLRPEFAGLVTEEEMSAQYTLLNEGCDQGDVVNRLLHLNARTYLLDDLNVKTDRASMAASLETRSPFLDTDLIDYVARLPGRFKVRGTQLKWILKRALRDLLPEETARRKKMGFGVPLGAWFRGELREEIEARLLRDDCLLHVVAKPEVLRAYCARHQTGDRDLGGQLWLLWQLDLWMRRTPLTWS